VFGELRWGEPTMDLVEGFSISMVGDDEALSGSMMVCSMVCFSSSARHWVELAFQSQHELLPVGG
jgi:hypothetical protein